MATKDSALKKKLIKEGIIAAVVLVALGAAGMLLSNYDDDATGEKQSKQNESAGMQGEYASIQQQLGSGFEVSAFYNTYIANHSSDMMPNRETATQWMTALRETNHLTNLSVTISPISDTALDFMSLKSGTPVKSEVHLGFGSVTDNSVYGFIESLQHKLPGMMLMSDIKLTHANELSREALLALSQHRITPLVTGEITFTWLGIRSTEQEKTLSGAGNGAR